ncbi:MAG TPA: nitrous oxide-stimulated promoter family protein [Chloroflexi bacterium]|nr:nitrous oxide-stimulated promoter family protein [Chloroflexota bacterium]
MGHYHPDSEIIVPAIFTDRLYRERTTMETMIAYYCRHKHGSATMCPDCQALYDYACERLKRCPFQAEKPTCANCKVHCYRPEMRQQVKAVMRYSGPRMLTNHPVLAIMHLVDGLRPAPELKKKQG